MLSISFFLAHGAGAGHENAFLQQLNHSISKKMSKAVVPVTFSYMEEQEKTGKKRPPPRFPKLIPEFESHIAHEECCVVAGKSMGGRVATQLSTLPQVKGVVCFGFPFYPAGKPEKNRLGFLSDLNVPCLIIQGTRDALGNYDWVTKQTLPECVKVVWVEGADHDFKTLKKQNKDVSETINDLANITYEWLLENI